MGGFIKNKSIKKSRLMKNHKIVERAIEEFTKKLSERHNIDSIILFGSYSRGEEKEDSDVDLLIIGDVKLKEVIDVAYPIFLKYGVYLSPIVMQRNYYEMLKNEKSGFIETVAKDGVLIYGRV